MSEIRQRQSSRARTAILLARVRRKVRREAADREEEAHEGGELNLVPFLDILVNTVIFLLATTAVAVPLSEINISAPPYVDPNVEEHKEKPAPPRAPEPFLSVTVSYSGFLVGGPGGMLDGPGGALPTVPCAGTLREGRCPVYPVGEGPRVQRWVDRYDYDALRRLARAIKKEHPDMRRAFIAADREVPYRVVVRTMDMLRGAPTARCTGADGCLFDQVAFATGVR